MPAKANHATVAIGLLPGHPLSPHYLPCSTPGLSCKTGLFTECFPKVFAQAITFIFYSPGSHFIQLSPLPSSFCQFQKIFKNPLFSLTLSPSTATPKGASRCGVWPRKCATHANHLAGQD